MKTEYTDTIATPIGRFLIRASETGVRSLTIIREIPEQVFPGKITERAKTQISEYFENKRKLFELPVDYDGLSAFQISIMHLLREIPYGSIISYTELSKRYGNLKSIRAVANANARNPLPLIIPCHRVVGKNGNLTGYALGLDIKKALLIHENAMLYSGQQCLEL